MKTLYHGSPTGGIEVLEPRHDERLNMEGLFVADEPFGPMMFALLPVRAHATVEYETKNGKFVQGKVRTPAINDEGWLYTLEVADEMVKERKPGRYYLEVSVPVAKTEKVTKEDVLKLGWTVEIIQ
jgi:hypothetical protein